MLPYPHIGLFVFNRKKQQNTFRKPLTNISQGKFTHTQVEIAP